MDQIPVEVLKMVFERLPIGQLDELRTVCKKWQYTIDHLMSFDCLVVYGSFLPVNHTFFHTNERVSMQYCISLEDFIDPSEFKKRVYSKFKRLCLHNDFRKPSSGKTERVHGLIGRCSWAPQMALTAINHLKQLEELHLWPKSFFSCRDRLSLPNLKTFQTTHFFDSIITLDAPQLTTLSFSRFLYIELVHPEIIEILEVKNGGQRYPFMKDTFCKLLTSLTSLTYLWFEDATRLDPILMKQFNVVQFLRDRVKEIHFSNNVVVNREFCGTMKELKKQPSQIKIYLNGLEIDHVQHLLEEFAWLPNQQDLREKCLYQKHILVNKDQLNFYKSHSSALLKRNQLPLCKLNYSLIEGLFKTHDLFNPQRLARLEVVIVNKQVQDELVFGGWLSGLKRLVEVIFKHPLSQDFYTSTLPTNCPTLQCLTLAFHAPLNFSFLLKFKFLYRLDLGGSEYCLVERLFSNLSYLKYLAFREYSNKISKVLLMIIKREEEKKMVYEIYDGKKTKPQSPLLYFVYQPVKLFDSFESLIEFTNDFTGF